MLRDETIRRVIQFRDDREWRQFHTPKDLAISLSLEAAELLEARGVKPSDFAGWKKVDAFERAEGAKEGREHKKVIDPEQMRALAHA